MRRLALLLLAACATPDPAADRAAYLKALESGSVQACLEIGESKLAGECVSATAQALPFDDASAACASVSSAWGDECFFQLAESLPASDPRRRPTCERAGQWAADCMAHLQARDVRRIWRRHDDPGQAHEELIALHGIWFPERSERERAESTQAIVARLLDQGHPPGPFDAARCGTAPRETCALSYAQSQMRLPRERTYDAMCGQPITATGAREAKVRPWTLGSEATVQAAWDLLCLRLEATGHLPPNIGPPPLIQVHRAPGRPGRQAPPGRRP